MKDLNNFLLVVTISLILVTHDSGAVPSHIRQWIQPFHSVTKNISVTIQKKKELADITRNFMNKYIKKQQSDLDTEK